jgi:glycerol-3-phosphate dehydrogenase
MISFSSKDRDFLIDKAKSESFDLIVIGGGITGAGIALDASTRGMKVILIEKDDFASGTSSKSTKLIHGGLRYLKQLDFKLVKEVGQERAIVYKNAPHLVYPEPMLLPVLKGGSLGKTSTAFALWLYETLAGVKSSEKGKMLSKEATLLLEPLLNDGILKGAALYTEYRTDDARLTIEICKTSVSYGSTCLNYVKVNNLIYENEKVIGVHVIDQLNGNEFRLIGANIVNAAGPWVDDLREMDGSRNGKFLHLTKGIHIVVSRKRFPLKNAVYFDHSNGRMIFAIPRDSYVYIGTTDTNYSENKDNLEITTQEVQYLLDGTNRVFFNIDLKLEDIKSSWAGLRPLIHQEGKSPSELSRKDELFISKSGLISIAGGKLTGYRIMAKKSVDFIVKRIKEEVGKDFGKCLTKNIVLGGGDFKSEIEMAKFIEQQIGESKQIGGNFEKIKKLVFRYGRNTEKIIALAYDLWPEIEDKESVIQLAEIKYCEENEMAIFPSDFWIRRTGELYFEPNKLVRSIEIFKDSFRIINFITKSEYNERYYSLLKTVDKSIKFKI